MNSSCRDFSEQSHIFDFDTSDLNSKKCNENIEMWGNQHIECQEKQIKKLITNPLKRKRDTFNYATDHLTIPNALLEYSRDQLFSIWEVLENQLVQIDKNENPDIYHELDERAATVFNAWLCFRYVGQGA